jgi:hypothetical protein
LPSNDESSSSINNNNTATNRMIEVPVPVVLRVNETGGNEIAEAAALSHHPGIDVNRNHNTP